MTDKERVDYIIKYSKMNMSEFARHVDLNGPHVIYDVRNGKNGISKDLANKIQAKFSNFNLAWILTGKGDIFKMQHVQDESNIINDKEVSYRFPDVTIPQKDFSSLVDTLSRQQRTIESQSKTIEELMKKKNGTNGNGKNASSA